MFCSSSRPARAFRRADWCPPQTRTDGHTCKSSAVRMRAEHTGAQRLSQMDSATRVDCDTSGVAIMKVRGHCLRLTARKGAQSSAAPSAAVVYKELSDTTANRSGIIHNCNQEWDHTQLQPGVGSYTTASRSGIIHNSRAVVYILLSVQRVPAAFTLP